MTLTVGSLFSGIGGIDLGLERAGMKVLWQVEIDEWCRAVLAKHWPDVERFEDVRGVGAGNLPRVDLIAGGFPCPVVSQAARGRNVAEWLWPEFARIVRELRPRYILVENVEGLLSRGRPFGEVLGDLASSGFDATWRVLRASDFGASHHRPRVWVVAYAHGLPEPDLSLNAEVVGVPEPRGAVRRWPDPPRGLGVADGIPARLDRLAGLGNAVVPQVVEWIGRRIVEAEGQIEQ